MVAKNFDRSKLPVIGTVGGEKIYLVEDHELVYMKRVLVGEGSGKPVILGSVARFRPYDEVILNDSGKM